MMKVNGKKLKDVWNTFSDEDKEDVCAAVGKTYILGERQFINREIYETFNDDQKKYANLMCNLALKSVSSPWKRTCEFGNPFKEGVYWCIVTYADPADNKIHAKIDTRYFGEISSEREKMTGNYNIGDKYFWHLEDGSRFNEEVYAWIPAPIHSGLYPKMPENCVFD